MQTNPRNSSQTTMADQVVGRVVGLWRYPVKSMAAEVLSHADVSWHGLAGDRRWAFVRDGIPQSGFPWLTLRENAQLRNFHPRFVDPDQPDKSQTIVATPEGGEFDVTDRTLAARLHGPGCRVIRQSRGVFDTFPLSLISTQSVSQLGQLVGADLDVQRFRPNLLVEALDEAGAASTDTFPEDAWVGRVLRIGDMKMRIDKRDGRCVVITIDPTTSETNPEILRTVARERDNCMGVYGSTVLPGCVAVGDAVAIVSESA